MSKQIMEANSKIQTISLGKKFINGDKDASHLLDIKPLKFQSTHQHNNENEITGGFQEATGNIFAIAQFCGIMPVIGVKSKSASKLHFEWNAFRTIYFFVTACILSVWAALCFGLLFANPITVAHIVPVVFNTSSACGIWSFGNIAKKWPDIMKFWEKVEIKLLKYRSRDNRRPLKSQIKLYTISFCVCAVADHLLTGMSDIFYVNACQPDRDLMSGFFERQSMQLFQITDYELWKGLLGKAVNIMNAFVWNYMNIFIIIISIGISSGLKQLNDELKFIRCESFSEDYWEFRRTQYRSLAELCEIVDEAIAPITILALANNLFFVCIQLMKSLRPIESIPHAVYFYYSLIFLLMRTLAILLFASSIHDESKRPAKVLRMIQRKVWCTEIERFIEEVVNDTLAISGMRFFHLTRKLILSVAGTILTYEIVLVQFGQNGAKSVCDDQF